MAKGKDSQKAGKKQATKTLKEKRQAKRDKKGKGNSPGSAFPK